MRNLGKNLHQILFFNTVRLWCAGLSQGNVETSPKLPTLTAHVQINIQLRITMKIIWQAFMLRVKIKLNQN